MYSTDLKDEEWEYLGPLVDQGKMGRPRKHEIRTIINAIRYVMRSGCQWRLLPKEFPPWKTVYDYFFRWRRNGKWQEIHDFLVLKVREKMGKNAFPTVGIIDSQSVKTVQKGGLEGMMLVKRLKAVSVILQSIH